ncbi:MAG: flagellar protein FlgN [Deltaproteobacteria bacterium]|nr:flagellar protein FlgN [Deltaproteobacteria bacterium]
MQLNGLLNELSGLLHQETELYGALLALMDNEKQAVIATNSEKLNEITKAKENLLLKLRILDEQRSHLLRKLADVLGQPENALSLKNLSNMVEAPHASRLRRSRTKLLSLITEVQAANSQNRALFTHSLELVRGSMNLLNNLMTSNPVYFRTGDLQQHHQTGNILHGEF